MGGREEWNVRQLRILGLLGPQIRAAGPLLLFLELSFNTTDQLKNLDMRGEFRSGRSQLLTSTTDHPRIQVDK